MGGVSTTTARTTATKVEYRLGASNIDSDIDSSTMTELILEESAYIERFTNKITFSTLDTDLVTRIATDLVAARICEHQAIGLYYGGANYKIGKLTVDKNTGGKQMLAMAKHFREQAMKGLEVLGGSAHFRWAVANP